MFAADGSGFEDVTLCGDCYSEEYGDTRNNDEPLGYWQESDTPWHCDNCEALIVTGLTSDGVEYVREAIENADGRPEILAAWAAGLDVA